MKDDILWHEECLKNSRTYWDALRKTATETIRRCEKADKEDSFYEAQIAEAKRRNMTKFDRDKLMRQLKPRP